MDLARFRLITVLAATTIVMASGCSSADEPESGSAKQAVPAKASTKELQATGSALDQAMLQFAEDNDETYPTRVRLRVVRTDQGTFAVEARLGAQGAASTSVADGRLDPGVTLDWYKPEPSTEFTKVEKFGGSGYSFCLSNGTSYHLVSRNGGTTDVTTARGGCADHS